MQSLASWISLNLQALQSKLSSVNWYQLATLLLSVFGAYMVWREYNRKSNETKLNVNVKVSSGFISLSQGSSEHMIFVDVINKGEVSVTISSVFLKLPNNASLISTHHNSNVMIPYKLEPRTSFKVWFGYNDVVDVLQQHKLKGKIKVCGIARDQTESIFKSKPFVINLAKT